MNATDWLDSIRKKSEKVIDGPWVVRCAGTNETYHLRIGHYYADKELLENAAYVMIPNVGYTGYMGKYEDAKYIASVDPTSVRKMLHMISWLANQCSDNIDHANISEWIQAAYEDTADK
jgi:hypothetical protein